MISVCFIISEFIQCINPSPMLVTELYKTGKCGPTCWGLRLWSRHWWFLWRQLPLARCPVVPWWADWVLWSILLKNKKHTENHTFKSYTYTISVLLGLCPICLNVQLWVMHRGQGSINNKKQKQKKAKCNNLSRNSRRVSRTWVGWGGGVGSNILAQWPWTWTGQAGEGRAGAFS